jgi:hypothetical protein
MKKQGILVKFLIFWHAFISFAFLVLFFVRRNNNRYYSGDLLIGIPIIERSWFDLHGIDIFMVCIMASALTSAILLVFKKNWKNLLSIILGILLLIFGSYLLSQNIYVFFDPDFSFLTKLFDFYFGACAGFIDLICIGYGIFATVFFTPKNVRNYLANPN